MQRLSQHERGLTLGELARRNDCALRGKPDIRVHRVAPLARADSRCIAFFLQRAYLDDLRATSAAAVILSERYAGDCPVAALLTPDPYGAYARVADDLHALAPLNPGVHPHATVSPGAGVDSSCEVSPGARVGAGAVLERGVFLGPNVTVGAGARIGEGSRLLANAVICEEVRIGRRCIVHPSAVLGSDGFGQAPADGARLDNLIQVGHNVHIGEHTAIAAGCMIAGSARIGRRCRIAGSVGIAGHLEICDDVVLLARTVVTRSVREPGAYAGSMTPMEEVSSWRRNAARFRRLDELYRRVRRLERRK